MASFEIYDSNKSCNHRISNYNNLLGFICKSVLSKSTYLDGRNNTSFISSCWDTYRFFRKRETHHSEKLNNAYKRIQKLGFIENEWRISLNAITDDISYFNHAISHLKSYEDDYKTWNKINTLIEEHNELAKDAELTLKREIRTQAREYYPNYAVSTTKPDINIKNINFYNLIAMFDYLFDYLYKGKDQGVLISDFILYHKITGNRHKIDNELQKIILETDKELDAEPEKLKAFMSIVCDDDKIKIKFSDLKKKREEADSTMKGFSNRIKNLSEDIDLGHVIKGKCNLGY